MVSLPPAFTEKRPEVCWCTSSGTISARLSRTTPKGSQRDGGQLHLHGHLACHNPLEAATFWRLSTGPHAYISPNWYATRPSVPTWNQVDVHAYGTVQLVEDAEWLRRFLVRLSERHEARNPAAWRMQDLPRAYVETMLKGIIGFDIAVTRLEGKYKLSQNRPAADRPGVVVALETQSDPESRAVARLMRDRKTV